MKTLFPRRAGLSVASAGLLALSACGGGGGGSGFPLLGLGAPPAPAPAPASPGPVTVSGKVVVIGPVSGALVCVDRNRNNACDGDEPAAAKTGDDGAYAFSYTPSDQTAADALAAAPLVAQVDGNNPSLPAFTQPITMSAPAGHRTQINPLTTLVQAGVASGLTPERAEAAVLLQLGVPELAQLYDYQGVPVTDPNRFEDNAFTAALVTADALHSGVPLRVVDPATSSSTPSDQLASLSFANPSNYFAETFPTDGVVDPTTGKLRLADVREGRTNGVATAHDALYPQLRLGANGWVRCDENASFTSTIGTPSRSDFCAGTSLSMSYPMVTDIAGRKMAEVVAEMQAADGNSIVGVNSAAAFADPNAVFPEGSRLTHRRGVNLTQPYAINLVDPSERTGYTTLEGLIAGRLVGGVNLADGSGSHSLGLLDDTHILRAASIDGAQAVQYYRCDFSNNVSSNCVAIATGTVEIRTMGGARVLEFKGHPETTVSGVRSYGEYGGAVHVARKTKSATQYNLTTTRRLNGAAWEAMKPQLGIGSGPV